jgi:heat shock protein HslJ
MKQIKHVAWVALGCLCLAITPPVAAQEMPKGGASNGAAMMTQKQFPLNVQWILSTLNGKPAGDNQPTLLLDSQLRMRGFAGCNTYSATAYPAKNQGIAVGPLALTKKECDKATNEFEKAYLLSLRTSLQGQVKDGFLYLLGEKSELKFERALF